MTWTATVPCTRRYRFHTPSIATIDPTRVIPTSWRAQQGQWGARGDLAGSSGWGSYQIKRLGRPATACTIHHHGNFCQHVSRLSDILYLVAHGPNRDCVWLGSIRGDVPWVTPFGGNLLVGGEMPSWSMGAHTVLVNLSARTTPATNPTPTTESRRYLDAVQACAYLGGLNSRTLTRFAREGYVPAYPIGEGKRRLWKFLEGDLDEWMLEGRRRYTPNSRRCPSRRTS
jgi:Helix-turn-helix domain